MQEITTEDTIIGVLASIGVLILIGVFVYVVKQVLKQKGE
jgi:hypothetical protein